MVADNDDDEGPPLIRGPLTAELNDTHSPVRRFLSDRFTNMLHDWTYPGCARR